MTSAPTAAEVMIGATNATLRAGRLPPKAVINAQLDALFAAGFRIEPHRDDGGAALLLAAVKSAFRSARFAPAAVVPLELVALSRAGHAFVPGAAREAAACQSFRWGPRSFEACADCGRSFWEHHEGTGHHGRAHRR